MEQIKIYLETELIEGGCNACRTTTEAVYELELNNKRTPIAELDVISILGDILRRKGYTRQQEYDVLGDYDIFANQSKEIQLFESYSTLKFVSGNSKITVAKTFETHDEVFETVNQLLLDVFEEEAYEFIFEL